MSALALGRQMMEGWNSGRLDLTFATFDADIVVRMDPVWPERVCFGKESAERFWYDVLEAMGRSRITVEEEQDLGDRAFWRVRQPVHSPSGVESVFPYSFMVTARRGKIILIEFVLDDTELRAELGIGPGEAEALPPGGGGDPRAAATAADSAG